MVMFMKVALKKVNFTDSANQNQNLKEGLFIMGFGRMVNGRAKDGGSIQMGLGLAWNMRTGKV